MKNNNLCSSHRDALKDTKTTLIVIMLIITFRSRVSINSIKQSSHYLINGRTKLFSLLRNCLATISIAVWCQWLMPSAVTRDVRVRREVSALGKGAARGIDRGLRCCQTGGEDVLARRQWAPASAERPILRIPVSCLLSTVSRGLLNRGHVLGRHLSCNYSTRIRFWWCVMITNNYCAFHASNRPRWGPRVLTQRRERGEDKEEGVNVKKWKEES